MEKEEILAQERDLVRKLHRIGIPADLKGYFYLIEAIKITVADKEAVFEITKNIYEPIAAQFGVSPRQVSRAIVHAIEVGWDRGDLDTLQDYFGYSVSNYLGRPTGSEFIAIVAERVRLEFED